MAGIIHFAIVLLSVQYVFARDCSKVNNIDTCSECIRCGAHWCMSSAPGAIRCTMEPNPDCPDDKPLLERINSGSLQGKTFTDARYQANALIGQTSQLQFYYESDIVPKIDHEITSTTQTEDITIQTSTHCEENNCTTIVTATAGKDFCKEKSHTSEFVDVRLHIEDIEEVVDIKYHVPCACICSQSMEMTAEVCNMHGYHSCGSCYCRGNWKGEFCEEPICAMDRGDVTCTNPANNLDCSGNGYCGGPCQTCQCYTDLPGSQYFDKDNYCSDLCLTIGTYCADDCLRNTAIGVPCEECSNLVLRPYNHTELISKDAKGRDNWVNCNETVSDCYMEYAAMIGPDGETLVMVTSSCDGEVVGAAPAVRGSITITIPVILGMVGFAAAASAVAGYIFYRQRAPPLPLMDPHYQNIGAEDCTGVNPLYKPPTSSFINPTYRK